MKAAILIVCCVITASLALPWPINTRKSKLAEVEEKLNEVEAVLKGLQKDEPTLERGKLTNEIAIEAILNGLQDKSTSGRSRVSNNTSSNTSMEEMLLHTTNIEAATAEIESTGGRVTMQLGDNILVVRIPPEFVAKMNSFASASAHISSSASLETLTYVQAYWMAREKKFIPLPPPAQRWTEKTVPVSLQPPAQHWTEKTAPITLPLPAQCWTEKIAPVHLPREPPFLDEANSPYRKTMTGKIAFTAIIVSGPGSLAISNDEKKKILSEIIAGLDFWANAAPATANLQFKLYHGYVSISAADSTSCSSYPACHNVFADPALEDLGFSTGQAGKDELAQYVKDRSGSDGAYIGFFSKYKQNHFAYAYFGGGPLYMQYSNDGWGPDQLDRVFAHETGHVFNAPGEYTTGKCNCNKNYGEGSCNERNHNCADCTSSQNSCIMNSNQFSICSFTRKHVGWCD